MSDTARRLRDTGVSYRAPLERPRLLCAMAEADAVLNTSKDEGMCNSLLEAMALGRPVIARVNRGNAALVRDGVTGALFKSPAQFRERLRALFDARDGPRRRQSLAQAATQHVQRAHAIRREISSYAELFRDALG